MTWTVKVPSDRLTTGVQLLLVRDPVDEELVEEPVDATGNLVRLHESGMDPHRWRRQRPLPESAVAVSFRDALVRWCRAYPRTMAQLPTALVWLTGLSAVVWVALELRQSRNSRPDARRGDRGSRAVIGVAAVVGVVLAVVAAGGFPT